MANITFIFSSKELSAKERIQIKDRSDAISISSLVDSAGDSFPTIEVDYFTVLSVDFDDEEKENFTTLVIRDKNGSKYTTSSTAFRNSFMNIYEELAKDGVDEFVVECYKSPCTNRVGNYYACRLV